MIYSKLARGFPSCCNIRYDDYYEPKARGCDWLTPTPGLVVSICCLSSVLIHLGTLCRERARAAKAKERQRASLVVTRFVALRAEGRDVAMVTCLFASFLFAGHWRRRPGKSHGGHQSERSGTPGLRSGRTKSCALQHSYHLYYVVVTLDQPYGIATYPGFCGAYVVFEDRSYGKSKGKGKGKRSNYGGTWIAEIQHY